MESGVGRLGAIGAPILIGVIVALNLPIQQNFFVIALAGLIGAVALSLINHRRADMAQVQSKTNFNLKAEEA